MNLFYQFSIIYISKFYGHLHISNVIPFKRKSLPYVLLRIVQAFMPVLPFPEEGIRNNKAVEPGVHTGIAKYSVRYSVLCGRFAFSKWPLSTRFANTLHFMHSKIAEFYSYVRRARSKKFQALI